MDNKEKILLEVNKKKTISKLGKLLSEVQSQDPLEWKANLRMLREIQPQLNHGRAETLS